MDNEVFNEIEEKMQQLDRADKLELVLDIISNLQGDERSKIIEEYNKQGEYHNSELKKAEENYWGYEQAYIILSEEIY